MLIFKQCNYYLGIQGMKKFLFLSLVLLFTVSSVYAIDELELAEQNSIQTRIDRLGAKILNSNQLDKRVVFVYDEKEKSNILNSNKSLTKREVIILSLIHI